MGTRNQKQLEDAAIIYILDTETNGQEKPEVIELAVSKIVAAAEGKISLETVFHGYFKPEAPSTNGALAVHGILPDELVLCPPSVLAKSHLPTDMQYVIGHGVDYDCNALDISPQVKRICTLAMARSIWPLAQHTLSAMLYHIYQLHNRPLAECKARLRDAHSAQADVEFCAELLMHIGDLNPHIDTPEKLWEYSEECRIPKVWSFGKYKGQPVAGTDRGYLSWCLRQEDMDEYVKLACSRELASRR